ncbi:MAG: cytochrome P450 [Sandaracinaceae bacterium]
MAFADALTDAVLSTRRASFDRALRVVEAAAEDRRARGRHGRLPPGPPEPAAVQTARWLLRPTAFLRGAFARYGEVFTLRLMGLDPFVCFTSPAAIKEVFTGSGDDLYAGQANIVLEPILGPHSVILLDGPRHMRQRRLLLPPFHGERMRAYGEAMAEITQASIDGWPEGEAFRLQERTQAITLDVILRTVFGAGAGSEERALRQPLEALLTYVANPVWLVPQLRRDYGPGSPGRRLRDLLGEVDAALFALLRRHRAATGEGTSILHLLLQARDEDGAPMGDDELRDELLTLLVAGHETTATALGWAIGLMLESPSTLERAVREVDDALGDGPLDVERMGELPYLDAVAKESLRLAPVIPIVGRRLQRPLRLGGLDLPRGVVAVPNVYLTHHNPRVWPDPDRFDPERFLGTRVSPYAFLPFGGGIRRCIGMAFALYEMRVVLATILRRVRLAPAPGYRLGLTRRSITFSPTRGLPVVASRR